VARAGIWDVTTRIAPLNLAATKGDTIAIAMLLQSGARVSMPDGTDLTPLDVSLPALSRDISVSRQCAALNTQSFER
jgi:hypothetical protein